MNHFRAYIPAAVFASLALVFSAIGFRLSYGVAYEKPHTVLVNPHRVSLNAQASFLAPSPSSSPTPTVSPTAVPSRSEHRDVVTAAAYLVGNITTGKIILERDSSTPFPVASMSKLVTAVAATDAMALTTPVEVTDIEMSIPPDMSNIAPGERFSLEEMLYPLLVASSNVAAEAIARIGDRAQFLESMSGYAWEIGMPQAFFADPSGLDPRNVASAQGIFALAQYLYSSRRDILAITREPSRTIDASEEHGMHDFTSTHPFAGSEDFIGGKTGRTPEAGETMLTIMRIRGEPIAFVVLKSYYGARERDTRILIGEYMKTLE